MEGAVDDSATMPTRAETVVSDKKSPQPAVVVALALVVVSIPRRPSSRVLGVQSRDSGAGATSTPAWNAGRQAATLS
jgi:hypothetical protein